MKNKKNKAHGVRTCVICRKLGAKASLRRYVWGFEAGMPVVDKKQTMAGRGAYCCATGNCQGQLLERQQRWKRFFRLG